MCRSSRERLQQQDGIFGQLSPVTLVALLIALVAVAALLHQAV
ncbi:hypothetical protein T261_5133 [Streptomyces lydicus]|nr:hypothetical protein T261_5133 [Streptomyces lydicus]